MILGTMTYIEEHPNVRLSIPMKIKCAGLTKTKHIPLFDQIIHFVVILDNIEITADPVRVPSI